MKNKLFRISKDKKGFTLGELLAVVAIMIILFAIGVPAIFAVQKRLRQAELDAKAETIYVAAQNKLSKMKAAGDTGYKATDDDAKGTGIAIGNVRYFTSNDKDQDADSYVTSAVMSSDVIEGELYSNDWVIEYDPENAVVYSVFYSENRADVADEYTAPFDAFREKSYRLSDGARIGYYAGGLSGGKHVQLIHPIITVTNTEKLTVQIKCMEANLAADYTVVLTDTAGNKQTLTITTNNGTSVDGVKLDGVSLAADNPYIDFDDYVLTLNLDDLTSADTRFASLYNKLLAGTKLHVAVTVQPQDHTYASSTVSADTNGLFADSSTADTAVIRYGRHLQNMDESSGVNALPTGITTREYITTYTLEKDIDFAKTTAETEDDDKFENWAETYNKSNDYFNKFTAADVANFKPIVNKKFTSFEGNDHTVAHLTESCVAVNSVDYNDSDLGLFADVTQQVAISDVMMTGTWLSSGKAGRTVGALAGKVNSNATITGCQVYLTEDDYGTGSDKKTNAYIWINGQTAGGLIGAVTGGSLTIEGSSASTVIGGHSAVTDEGIIETYTTESAGGLIGSVSGGTVKIAGSYADNYLAGKTAGGLVGSSSVEASALSVGSSYAAGYMSYTTGAGIAAGKASLQNVYTIEQGLYLKDGTTYYSTAESGTVTGKAYYAKKSSSASDNLSSDYIGTMTSEEIADGFGTPTPFVEDSEKETSKKAALYNLMDQGLTTYDYPALANLKHYGDYGKEEGFTLNLMHGTTSTTPYWSSKMPEAFESITYTAPTAAGWELDGWYTSYTDSTSSIPSEIIKVLDKDGKVVAGNGNYIYDETTKMIKKADSADNLVFSVADGAVTLSQDLTLYACWHKSQSTVYVLTNTFKYDDKTSDLPDTITVDCGKYLIASGKSDTVKLAGNSGSDLSYTSVTVHNGTLNDGSKKAVAYIDLSDANSNYVWTATPSRVYLNKTDIPDLPDTYTDYNTDNDYGASFTLSNNEMYLCRSGNAAAISSSLSDGNAADAWSFENRMFKYPYAEDSYTGLYNRYDSSSWPGVMYYKADGTLDCSNSMPDGASIVYIYEKQTIALDTYTFDVTYTVTFDENGHGTAPDPQTLKAGSKVTRPADLTADGYEFEGWYKEKSCKNEWKFAKDEVNADITLYAKWASKLQTTLKVVNEETLTASVNCTVPARFTDIPVFRIEIEDTDGNVYTAYYAYSDDNESEIRAEIGSDAILFVGADSYNQVVKKTGRTYSLKLTLDDLTASKTRFVNRYGSGSSNAVKLLSGTPIKITATALCPGNDTIESDSDSAVTNSLFADDHCTGSGVDGLNGNYGDVSSTAVVKYGRHLQNLDTSSGIVDTVQYVHQGADISFAEDTTNTKSGTQYWYGTYAKASDTGYFNGTCADGVTPNFKPITNSNLKAFSGSDGTTSYLISSLSEYTTKSTTADRNADVGLFSALSSGQQVNHVTMTGPCLIAKGNNTSAGAIAGTVTGNASINSCQVYLSTTDVNNHKTNKYVWISGKKSAGGLVGAVTDGTLSIEKSSAAAVIGEYTLAASNKTVSAYSTQSVGGLVGSTASDTEIRLSDSFADSYMIGTRVGGLVGSSKGTVSAESCFAAGFLNWETEAAGLIDGTVTDLENSYTIVNTFYADGESHKYYSTATKGENVSNVYYSLKADGLTGNRGTDLKGSYDLAGMTVAEIVDELGSDFTETSTGSTAYNLMSQSLTSYTYPALKAVKHHGDWSAVFKSGALVYYEKYSDGTYGFYGADVDSTLKDDTDITVVGDGYAIVYSNKEKDEVPESVTVSVTDGSTSVFKQTLTLASADKCTVTAADRTEYTLYPLSNANCNTTHASSGYYLKATVSNSKSASQNDYYYFNPHFAKTVVSVASSDATAPALTSDSEISVRTARHLYDMSLYYDTYATATQKVTYYQERDIDYDSYGWKAYSVRTDDCTSQEPIAGGDTVFAAVYNGACHKITDVSFVTQTGNYVGLFGRVGSGARLLNVVITTDYDKTSSNNNLVKRVSAAQANEKVWYGMLAGRNSGTINNCAAAGYYLAGADGTIHGYANSFVYIGNLVGQNDGTISNSEADSPRMTLSTYLTTAYAGGFVGYNSSTGTIRNCYGIGHISSIAQKGTTSIAGFAALNTGSISQSYCATALTASGDGSSSYGFAPDDEGLVTSCYYLNTGSYQFVDGLYAYETKTGAATYRTYEQLERLNTRTAVYSYNHTNTTALSKEETTYPYRTVISDADGKAVHYGEWQIKPEMGNVGFFYWEHEEGGENDGYKLTYIGSDEGQSQYKTTLCVSHDDGGVITEYGYGYYVRQGEEGKLQVAFTDAAYSAGTVQTAAEASLENQLPGYTLYPYTTADTAATAESSYGDYICFTGTGATAVCALTYDNTHSYKYNFTPLFANAMQLVSVDGKQVTESINITDNGGNTTDYSKNISENDSNQFEVRSAKQLQYINWNCSAKNASTLVSTGNYKTFNYLMYASVTGQGTQTYANAGNKTYRYWLQTHDLNASSVGNFTPIAGNTSSSSNSAYNATLYSWFGGSYNGQSYKIQELSITSSSYTVGLFGVTVGAQIENVILYSTHDAAITRSTTINDTLGSYALGGLIGVAYDYNSAVNKTITNCAIAGYRIIDDSKNQQARGEANVGGLIGVSNVNIDKCSAVTDIQINCTHKNSSGGITLASWGNYIRVGGISGAVQGKVTNSYSGGSMSAGSETLDETYTTSKVHVDISSTTQADRQCSTNIFMAGIAGSGFAMNYYNFTNNGSLKEGSPTITNCYTYVDFPKMEGTIRAITMIASVADRFGNGPSVTINNCYYLESSADIDTSNLPKYHFNSASAVATVINGTTSGRTYTQDMVLGYVNWEAAMFGEGKNSAATITLTSKTYSELSSSGMAGLLGSYFGNVTKIDGSGAAIDGKYSFPGSDKSLDGKNYPFPTVITQTDLTFGTDVNVHYGAWPHDTAYWENAMDTMDIFDSMSVDDGYAYGTFVLQKGNSDLSGDLSADDFTVGNDQYAEIVKVQKAADGESWLVTVKAKDAGSTTITEKQTGASFTLTITETLNVKAVPEVMTLAQDEATPLTVYATSAVNTDAANTFTVRESPDSNALTGLTKDSFTVGDDTVAEIKEVTKNADGESWTVTVTGLKAGETIIKEKSTGAEYLVTVTNTNKDLLPATLETECARNYSTDDNLTWVLTTSTLVSDLGDCDVELQSETVKNVYTVTGYGNDASIYITADYDYHDISYTGTTFATVQKKACIGVGYTKADDAEAYMEAEVKAGDKTVSGSEKTFTAGDMTPSKPVNDDLYLYDTTSTGILNYYVDSYEENDDGTIKNSTITISVSGNDTKNTLHTKLDTSLSEVVGNSYRTVGCLLYEDVPVGGTPSGKVDLTITVKSETGAVYTFMIKDYQLRAVEHVAIKYVADAGTTYVETADLVKGDTYTLWTQEQLVEKGYTVPQSRMLTGWKTSVDGVETTYEPGENIEVTDDTTFTAIWSNYLKLNANGGSFDDDAAEFYCTTDDAKVNLSDAGFGHVSRQGYVLKSWNTKADESGTSYATDADVDADGSTLYAQWTVKTTTLQLKAEDVTLSNAQYEQEMAVTFGTSGIEGTYVTPLLMDAEDKYFVGWFTKQNGQGSLVATDESGRLVFKKDVSGYTDENGNWAYDDNAATGTNTLTLYAYWTDGYTLTLRNGNSGEFYSESVLPNQTSLKSYASATITAPDGYTLEGWYTTRSTKSGKKVLNADGSIAQAVTEYTASTGADSYIFDLGKNQTLYACWNNGDSYTFNITYTVTYDTNGGDEMEPSKALADEAGKATVTLPAPTRENYQLRCWKVGTAEYNIGDVITLSEDITVTADWRANEYTIVYKGNNATSGYEFTQSATVGDYPELSSNKDSNGNVIFKRTGYTFLGWADTENTYYEAGDAEYEAGQQLTNDLTTTDGAEVDLYAVWQANTYTITYDGNGGSGNVDSQTATFDQAVTLQSNGFAVSDGKIFVGWNTAADGSGTIYSENTEYTNVSADGSDVTLYAMWQDPACQLTLVGATNDGNGSLTYTVPIGATSLSGVVDTEGYTYASPTPTDMEFVGWVTSPDDNGKLIIDADGNMITSADTTAYITDGKWSKSGEATLYARWKKTVYVKTTSVASGEDYLIGAESGTKVYLIGAESGTTLSSNTSFTTGSGTDISGKDISYITGTVSDSLKWTVSGQTSATIKPKGNYYLYCNSWGTLSLSRNSRNWTIGTTDIKYSSWQTFYLDPTTLSTATSSTPCYLYKADDIYVYSS